jgi:predicted transcriptional regulator
LAELIPTEGASDGLFPSGNPERSQSRRSILQIRMEILKVVMQGFGKPTQIMYKANLSWTVLQSQLKVFVQSGLLKSIEYGNRKKYVITERGIEMIHSYDRVIDEVLKD